MPQLGVGEQAEMIVEKIIGSLRDRRGLRQSWDAIDDEIQAEIRSEWTLLARRIIERG